MEKLLLKSRILFTNICRVTLSVLFINLVFTGTSMAFRSFSNSYSDMIMCYRMEILCYEMPAIISCYMVPEPTIEEQVRNFRMLWILVPIAIIIFGTIIVVKKIKKNKNAKSMEEINKDDK